MTAHSTRNKGVAKADVPRLFWTVNEFATATSLARDTVYRMLHEGRLAAVKINGEWRIPNSEIERLTAEAKANLTAGAA